MGSLILCHKKRAKQPYEISRVHMRIYTIEELCYYICNNLYLIDYTIINRQLCDWIGDELELSGLAETLREELRQNCSMEQFVLTILKESTIYAAADINRIQNILEHLQNQKDVERTKYKADSLQGSGEYETAILVYQSIINKEWDDSVEKTFYGHVYACLGAAYGHLFLYEEAGPHVSGSLPHLRGAGYAQSLSLLLFQGTARGTVCEDAFRQSHLSEHGFGPARRDQEGAPGSGYRHAGRTVPEMEKAVSQD